MRAFIAGGMLRDDGYLVACVLEIAGYLETCYAGSGVGRIINNWVLCTGRTGERWIFTL